MNSQINFAPIRPKLLLSFYGIVPLAFIVIACDILFLNSSLKSTLPSDPNEFLLFTLIFTLPHIMASFFGFIDKEYINHYGSRLLKGAQVIVLIAILLPIISLDATFLLFALLTMSHVFMQQSGVSKSLMKGANTYHRYWQWLGVILSFVLYISVYGNFVGAAPVWHGVFIGIALLYIISGLQAVKASRTKIGTYYFLATVAIPLVGYMFITLGYPIFAIATPRIVHDLTAFHFYTTHDYNRFLEAKSNYIYRLFAKFRISVFIASPLLGFIFALPFQGIYEDANLFIASMFVFLMHYYIESFMWKRGSLHRKYATPL